MFRLVLLSLVQCLFLAAGQVFLKFAMQRMGAFSWTWNYFRQLTSNWHLLASGLSMLSASLLWFYVIKNYPLSIAYPLISFSYVFGAFAAMYFFDESISAIRWVGIVLIMVGATLLTKG